NTALAPGATEEHRQTARTVANVVYDGPEAIEKRLTELDHEWTAGRVIKVASGLGIIVGLGLAAIVHVAWLTLPVAIGLLLLQYAVSRHSVLTWVLGSAGIRTGTDVEHERIALKALRGDFRNLPTVFDKADRDALARLEGEGGIAEGPGITPADSS